MSALETMMPPVKRAAVNGVEIAYYEAGPRTGVPIVLCHGFPELAFSWRHQIKALADAGRWVIAPDQRGYGLSSKPANVADYDIDHLTGDMVALLDHLGVEKAIFVGHDWGGIVVWQMPLLHPTRVAGVIGLNTPFLPRAPADPIVIMRNRFGPDMYIVWFQNPEEPEAVLGEDTAKTMRFFMRKPAALAAAAAPATNGSGSTFAFRDLLRQWDGRTGGDQLLTPEELAVFADAFRDGGFFGPVSWYRNFTRNWQRAETLPQRIDGIPCLMITAELDAVLTPEMAEPMPHFIGDLETHMVKGSGHWTQQEKPKDVDRLMLDWLDRRFPK
ncbi:alpha/beta hydrolase [Phenylobacterium sp.]|uniref:alpha/beta fold hydrolase n=1 Tax=Phenylobacterium sp. TaxID=1871053 RepID=UPI0025D1AAC5|nr:alpha/beta hydrolase [Phenylobacterium sp.]